MLTIPLALLTSHANAQLIKGVVRDATSATPVPGAFVALIDTSAALVYGVAADSRGRFTLQVRERGVYAVVATKEGYLEQTSAWLSLQPSDTLEVTPRMARLATTLAPVLVEAQRDSLRALSLLGLSLKNVGGTIVTPVEVSHARLGSRSMYDLIESLHVPTLRLKRMHVVKPPSEYPAPHVLGDLTCIAYARTDRCVTIIVDGVRHQSFADLAQLETFLSSESVDYLVFLRPAEAGVLFGTQSNNGVLIVVTKGASK